MPTWLVITAMFSAREPVRSKLTELAATGVRTIVDPTVIGLGRYIPRIQQIAEQVDLNIVVATGCYTYRDVPFFFHHRGPALNAAMAPRRPTRW